MMRAWLLVPAATEAAGISEGSRKDRGKKYLYIYIISGGCQEDVRRISGFREGIAEGPGPPCVPTPKRLGFRAWGLGQGGKGGHGRLREVLLVHVASDEAQAAQRAAHCRGGERKRSGGRAWAAGIVE